MQERISISSLEVYNKLNSMKNQTVSVLRNNEVFIVKVAEVKLGEILLVKRGEYVSLDGNILSEGLFDYSNITGESKQIRHFANDFVLSGSFNVGDNVKIKVTKLAKDSTLNHIIEKIEDVSATRPPMQQLADKILKIFIPTVLLIATATFFI